jgi:hypothetical protein
MTNLVNISLNNGQFSLIDSEDFELVSKYTWCAHLHHTKKRYYALSHDPNQYYIKSRSQVVIKLHRLIMGVTDSKILVDHINRDSLDNRKINLRVCSIGQNNSNTNKRENSISKYKGVRRMFVKGSGRIRWYSVISVNRKRQWIGTFDTEEDAAKAYNKAAIHLHGEFASLNKV